jgi:hypothetical protein
MATKTLEVLGIGPLRDRSFLVYFSDHTYATVSSEKLAECFPIRQVVPDTVTEDIYADSTFHAARAAFRENPHTQTN